jgi:hypothetical protein
MMRRSIVASLLGLTLLVGLRCPHPSERVHDLLWLR